MVRDGWGGGGCGSMRWVLREHGAIVLHTNAERVLVSGVVSDEVLAVHVGSVRAHAENNAFLAEIGRNDSPVVVVVTATGERKVGPRRP